jgi:uncharacterized membrane protein YdbT with pleckstrin-like domain
MPSYVEKTLESGETVRYQARLTWLNWVKGGFLAFIAIIGWSTGIIWLGVISALWFLFIALRQLTTEIAVTSKKVVYKRGLIARNTGEIRLTKIESTSIKQGIIDRLVGCGDVVVGGVGTGAISLKDIDKPLEFKMALDEARGSFAGA